jgi:SAM-dependent methyltransferase
MPERTTRRRTPRNRPRSSPITRRAQATLAALRRLAPRGGPARVRTARPVEDDRHVLYERAVQDAASELSVIDRVVRRGRGTPSRLREDFCGTALLAAAWTEAGPTRVAVGVDLDPRVLAWAAEHRVAKLDPSARRRLLLLEADVLHAPKGPFDAIVAFNFSWQVFKTRDLLRSYFAAARRSLAPDGAFMLDLMGGWLTMQPVTERRRLKGGATYVWEHESVDAITHDLRCAIHFELADGRRLKRAFTYDWRLWTLPEVTELLREAGFGEVEVLWDVKPVGVEPLYVPRRSAEQMGGWIAYVVARNGKPGRK